MKNYHLLICLIISCLIYSCDKDTQGSSITPEETSNHSPSEFAQNFGVEISRDFLGKVVDKNNLPIEGVTITIKSETATTDANGIFILKNASVNENFAYIKAFKTGYIHGSRALVPTNGLNKVNIMLLDEQTTGTTSNGNQETITTPTGASVTLNGGYIDENGDTYPGAVNVIMHHLSTDDLFLEDKMPGMLYASNSQNEERMLQTYGMLAVELRGENGEELNLAADSPAEIRIPLPSNITDSAPSSIPLWYFDEQLGYWIEEGEAILMENEYVGTVSHFSFWNCDVEQQMALLNIVVVNENNIPLPNIKVQLFLNDNNGYPIATRSGISNEIGLISGYVPLNQTLTISAFDLSCSTNAIFDTTLGAITEDINYTLVLPISTNDEFSMETVSGEFLTCDNLPITNGYVNLSHEGIIYTVLVSNGDFEISFLNCSTNSDQFQIQGVDLENNKISEYLDHTLTQPITDVGSFTSCANGSYMTFTLNGTETFEFHEVDCWAGQDAVQYFVPEHTFLLIASGPECNYFSLYGQNFSSTNYVPTVGTYSTYSSENTGGNFSIGEPCVNMGSYDEHYITYNVTQFGEPGEIIEIYFSGTVSSTEGTNQSIEGYIHVIRTQ
ncbi:MAG: hypothetical protein BM564_08430 [Bacteroidetes bacterium MedPE-SWsnd-G2]|nr:MAG: hypothetical protein BM564_08430 [Bacteroidetes bacterium MedPE-SWsnd-G2]